MYPPRNDHISPTIAGTVELITACSFSPGLHMIVPWRFMNERLTKSFNENYPQQIQKHRTRFLGCFFEMALQDVRYLLSWESKGIPQCHNPPRNKAFARPYEGIMVVNNP